MTNVSHADVPTLTAVTPSTAVAYRERRASTRRPAHFSISLLPMGGERPHQCLVDDISEDGLYVSVPQEAGLCVGQRCELKFPSGVIDEVLRCLTEDTCYATVVRTERRSDPPGSALGAGLRLDQPLFFSTPPRY